MDDDNINNFRVPEDALMEILARLPVKSLLRFLCVRKSWYSLIKNPYFITKHFNYASDNDEASRFAVINKYNRLCNTTVLSNDGVEIYHNLPNLFSYDDTYSVGRIGRIMLSSPCNGIICASAYEINVARRVVLWNPATREVNNVVLDDNGFEVKTIIGFGIDTKNNVYKVVRCTFGTNLRPKFIVGIYDVGNDNDSWRKLDDLDLPINESPGGSVYVDGFCYWLVSVSSHFLLLSFDFINEVFEKIPTPERTCSHRSISPFCESVAFVGLSLDHFCFIVWVLNSEGDKKTWCKQYSITKDFELYPRFLRSGKMVMVCYDSLDLYDPRSGERKRWMYVEDMYSIQVMNYVESLVSFKKLFPPYPKLPTFSGIS